MWVMEPTLGLVMWLRVPWVAAVWSAGELAPLDSGHGQLGMATEGSKDTRTSPLPGAAWTGWVGLKLRPFLLSARLGRILREEGGQVVPALGSRNSTPRPVGSASCG